MLSRIVFLCPIDVLLWVSCGVLNWKSWLFLKIARSRPFPHIQMEVLEHFFHNLMLRSLWPRNGERKINDFPSHSPKSPHKTLSYSISKAQKGRQARLNYPRVMILIRRQKVTAAFLWQGPGCRQNISEVLRIFYLREFDRPSTHYIMKVSSGDWWLCLRLKYMRNNGDSSALVGIFTVIQE